MLTANQIQSLSRLPEPIVSVYLNTHSADPSRHPQVPDDLAWLKKKAASLSHTLVTSDAKRFLKAFADVEKFIAGRRPEEKALAIFSGRDTWTLIPLHTNVDNELSWGKPAIGQLFRLLAEHRCYGIVAVDQTGARFFQFHLGELAELGQKRYEIDESQWKRNDLGHVASERTRKAHGPDRDLFAHRLEAQYERLFRETAEHSTALSKKHDLAGLFLVGPERLVTSIANKFSAPAAQRLITVPQDLGGFSPSDICRRIEPLVADYERKCQIADVNHALSAGAESITSADEVLARLQGGSVRTILAPADHAFHLRECAKCGIVSGSGDKTCANCGGERHDVTLLEALTRLAPVTHTKVEFVRGEAAEILTRAGGIAGWLRQQQSKVAS